MTEEEFSTGILADGTRLMQPNEAVEMIRLIDLLRAEEGEAVTIYNDNPDFGGPNCRIDCQGAWVDALPLQNQWHPVKAFFGDTVLDCLRQAQAEMEANRS